MKAYLVLPALPELLTPPPARGRRGRPVVRGRARWSRRDVVRIVRALHHAPGPEELAEHLFAPDAGILRKGFDTGEVFRGEVRQPAEHGAHGGERRHPVDRPTGA